MNDQSKIRNDLVQLIRLNLDYNDQNVLALADEEIEALIFYFSKRSKRLTKSGIEIVEKLFEAYVIELPDKHLAFTSMFLFLERATRLPYYYESGHLIIFDILLAARLALVDGNINKLVKLEGFEVD